MKRILLVALAFSLVLAPAAPLLAQETIPEEAAFKALDQMLTSVFRNGASYMTQMITGKVVTKHTEGILFKAREYVGDSLLGGLTSKVDHCRVVQLKDEGPPYNRYDITFISGYYEGGVIRYTRMSDSEGDFEISIPNLGEFGGKVYWLGGEPAVMDVQRK